MKVLTIGTFDLLHYGHLNLLNRAKEVAESFTGSSKVMVGVNSDRFVEAYKGEKPVMTEMERFIALKKIGYDCWMNDGPGVNLIRRTNPDVVVIGSDWWERDYFEQIGVDLFKEGISLMFVPYTRGISTTEIRSRL